MAKKACTQTGKSGTKVLRLARQRRLQRRIGETDSGPLRIVASRAQRFGSILTAIDTMLHGQDCSLSLLGMCSVAMRSMRSAIEVGTREGNATSACALSRPSTKALKMYHASGKSATIIYSLAWVRAVIRWSVQ